MTRRTRRCRCSTTSDPPREPRDPVELVPLELGDADRATRLGERRARRVPAFSENLKLGGGIEIDVATVRTRPTGERRSAPRERSDWQPPPGAGARPARRSRTDSRCSCSGSSAAGSSSRRSSSSAPATRTSDANARRVRREGRELPARGRQRPRRGRHHRAAREPAQRDRPRDADAGRPAAAAGPAAVRGDVPPGDPREAAGDRRLGEPVRRSATRSRRCRCGLIADYFVPVELEETYTDACRGRKLHRVNDSLAQLSPTHAARRAGGVPPRVAHYARPARVRGGAVRDASHVSRELRRAMFDLVAAFPVRSCRSGSGGSTSRSARSSTATVRRPRRSCYSATSRRRCGAASSSRIRSRAAPSDRDAARRVPRDVQPDVPRGRGEVSDRSSRNSNCRTASRTSSRSTTASDSGYFTGRSSPHQTRPRRASSTRWGWCSTATPPPSCRGTRPFPDARHPRLTRPPRSMPPPPARSPSAAPAGGFRGGAPRTPPPRSPCGGCRGSRPLPRACSSRRSSGSSFSSASAPSAVEATGTCRHSEAGALVVGQVVARAHRRYDGPYAGAAEPFDLGPRGVPGGGCGHRHRDAPARTACAAGPTRFARGSCMVRLRARP